MGEYLNLDGDRVKIGTLADLYYATWPNFWNLAQSGRLQQNDPDEPSIAQYLFGQYGLGSRFRFPWPDEDGLEVGGGFKGAFRGLVVEMPGYLPNLAHKGTQALMPPGGAGSFSGCMDDWPDDSKAHNLTAVPRHEVQCPMELDAHPCTYLGQLVKPTGHPRRYFVRIIQQQFYENQLVTIVACPWCGTTAQILDYRIARDIAAQLIHTHHTPKSVGPPDPRTVIQAGSKKTFRYSSDGSTRELDREVTFDTHHTMLSHLWNQLVACRMLSGYLMDGEKAKEKFGNTGFATAPKTV